MKTDISSGDNGAARPSSKSIASRAPAVVFALAVSALAVYAAANGPTLWSAAQRLKAEELQREDRMFCEKFNMPPGSEGFATWRHLSVGNQKVAWGQSGGRGCRRILEEYVTAFIR